MDGGSAARKVEEFEEQAGERSPQGNPGRRSRRKRQVRARTVAIKQMRKDELRLGAVLYPQRDYPRPRTRAECRCMERPCPFVGCKHHLYLDVSPRGGIKFNFPDLEVWEMQETCALDVAERPGGVTLEEVGAIMNLTRERIRQLEAIGLQRLQDAGLLELIEGGRLAAAAAAPVRRRRRAKAECEDEWARAVGDEED
jgi:hypothetical protein